MEPNPPAPRDGAAGLDLHACIDGPVVVPADGEAFIPTGIAAAIPEGYVGIMAVRSSMGIRHGITMTNGIGVIDSDYRGPMSVGLHNYRGVDYVVEPGDRIAQLVVVPVLHPEIGDERLPVRRDHYWSVDAGVEVQPRRPIGGIVGQGDFRCCIRRSRSWRTFRRPRGAREDSAPRGFAFFV